MARRQMIRSSSWPLCLPLVVVYIGGRRGGDSWTWVLSTRLARHVGYLELLLKLMFVNPPELPEQATRALPVRYQRGEGFVTWAESLQVHIILGGNSLWVSVALP